jgi:hypothetical protein
MRAAKDAVPHLDAVSNDLAIAMGATGGDHVNGALDTVKSVLLARFRHFKAFIVIVATDIAFGHTASSSDVGCIVQAPRSPAIKQAGFGR